jgi:hypothetical protein
MKPVLKKPSEKQLKAVACMRQIALCRDELVSCGYMRRSADGEPGKKIFSEFIEYYVADALGLTLAKGLNQKGYDAVDSKENRYQIKDVTHSMPVLRNFEFDFLVAVRLDKSDFSVRDIGVFPVRLVKDHLGRLGDFRITRELEREYFQVVPK